MLAGAMSCIDSGSRAMPKPAWISCNWVVLRYITRAALGKKPWRMHSSAER